MEVEIKNFFPAERQDKKGLLKGSLHLAIRLADVELNIRGILASRQNGKYFFRMPFRLGTCHKTGNSVTFPIFIFSNDELNKSLLDGIYKKAPAFIEEFLKMNTQGIEAQKTAEHIKPRQDEGNRKEAPPIAKKPMSAETAPSKKVVWRDMPKKFPTKNMSKGNYAGRR
jgi:hypothetical protein